MQNPPVNNTTITRVSLQSAEEVSDIVAVEEPLEIRISYENGGVIAEKSLSVTMRTPGNDLELVQGFLLTEGIIESKIDIQRIWHCETVEKEEEKGNVVKVNLNSSAQFDPSKLDRHFYTNSSCGVCGKSSIESVHQLCNLELNPNLRVNRNVLFNLTNELNKDQTLFKYTGGIHASALFNTSGKLKVLREDVGRHNALDKVAGWALEMNKLPLQESILLVSGRASFELVQKCVLIGVPIMCAVGAPSSLAVELARDNNLTLIGFLKNDRFNVYSGNERIMGI